MLGSACPDVRSIGKPRRFRTGPGPRSGRFRRVAASRRRPGTDACIATVPTPRPRRPARAPNMRPPSINHLAMERFDALVVGAGPAGSTAAFRLARAGARVLLVDKARFPRDKPCGGGLTVRAVRLLPFSVAPVVEEEVDVFELGLGFRRRFVRRTAAPLVVMTQRRRLDAFLVEQAQEAGVEFRDGATADGIDATVVIGADGVNGSFARSAGHVHEVALGGNVPYGPVSRRRYARRAVVEFGIVRAATAGSSRRATTSTSASGAGSTRDRICGSTSRGSAAPIGSRRTRSPTSAATGPAATAGIHARAGPNRARRRCGRPRRSGLRRRHLRSPAQRPARSRERTGDHRRPRRRFPLICRDIGSRARALCGRLLAGEAGARRFPNASFTLLQAPYAWRAMEKLLRADATHPGAIGGPAAPRSEPPSCSPVLRVTRARHSRGQRERLRPLSALTAVAAVALALSSAASADLRDETSSPSGTHR